MTIFGNQHHPACHAGAGGADGNIGCGSPSAPAEAPKTIYLHPMRCRRCERVVSCTANAIDQHGRLCPFCGRGALTRIWIIR